MPSSPTPPTASWTATVGSWQALTASPYGSPTYLRPNDGASAQLECDILIAACGVLVRPKYPDIPGLDSFAGQVVHSARWDHTLELAGERVGVIGSGSGVPWVSAVAAAQLSRSG